MDDSNIAFTIQPMQPTHLPAVMGIERVAFALPWPESAYHHEITQNELAHYYVLCFAGALRNAEAEPSSPWRRLTRSIWRHANQLPDVVLGYGGFWMMVDEAHISTLAVREDARGRGFGELLLAALLDESRNFGALAATLEVRVSNTVAQALYAKYGFEVVGRRRAYYQDNSEDALIMTTPAFSFGGYWQIVTGHRAALVKRLAAFDGAW
jgi:ribosomal-protein-alanine N-acetyltransferase